MVREVIVTGRERTFPENEIIVSKTDSKGIITYANDTFVRVAEYREDELLGKPHNMIRHPHMPRCVFKLLWDTIASGEEIFAYVMNRTKSGDHYWVLAHVTPSFGPDKLIRGYHSNRRVPKRAALQVIEPLYARLRAEEQSHESPKAGLEASFALMSDLVEREYGRYDKMIYTLQGLMDRSDQRTQ